MKKLSLFIVILMLTALSLTACSETKPTTVNLSRPIVPSAYAAKSNNPLAGISDAIEKGKAEFITNCQPCHGEAGNGEGSATSKLNPKPGKLGQNSKALSTAYLFWRISEGGGFEPFKSSMPPYKGSLSEEKIWQVISYLVSIK